MTDRPAGLLPLPRLWQGGSPTPLSRGAPARVFLALSLCWALLLVPPALFPAFPSQDGPAHVNAAVVLNRLAAGDRFLAGYFTDSGVALTNWASTLLFRLWTLALPAGRADQGFAIAYVVMMLAACSAVRRFLLRAPAGTEMLFYPLVFSHMLHMGSYNLVLADIGFLASVGSGLDCLRRGRAGSFLMLAAALLATCALHVQVGLLALLCVGICGAWALVLAVGAGGLAAAAGGWRRGLVRSAGFALAAVPASLLVVAFSLQISAGMKSHLGAPDLLRRLGHLVFLTGIATYSVFGAIVSVLLAGLLGLLVAVALRRRWRGSGGGPADALLACAVVLGALFLLVPSGFGEALNVEERLMIPWLLVVLCWLAVSGLGGGTWRMMRLVVIATLALQALDRTIAFAAIDRTLADYASARRCVPDGAALIAIDLDAVAGRPLHRSLARMFAPTLRFDPYVSYAGILAGQSEIAVVSNYETLPSLPYFQLKLQPWLGRLVGDAAMQYLAERQSEDGAFGHMLERLRGAPRPVDYLLLWSLDPVTAQAPAATALVQAVSADFVPVCRSDAGFAAVYRRRAEARKEGADLGSPAKGMPSDSFRWGGSSGSDGARLVLGRRALAWDRTGQTR